MPTSGSGTDETKAKVCWTNFTSCQVPPSASPEDTVISTCLPTQHVPAVLPGMQLGTQQRPDQAWVPAAIRDVRIEVSTVARGVQHTRWV